MNTTNILLRHNYIPLPEPSNDRAGRDALATVMMNISYYGYSLHAEAFKVISTLGCNAFTDWWKEVEVELKAISGDDRKIADFVVYKNFPAEVLDKSEAEYWFAQILMYWGAPNDFFTEEVKPRPKMDEQPKATILRRASKDTLNNIFNSYLSSPARWKDEELNDVLFLAKSLPVNVAKLAFKENLVRLASSLMANGQEINITTATDVLRLAAGLSDGDVSLREKPKFISFKKSVRRFLLSTLERCNNLNEDVARRSEMWKRLLHQLHPGDYKHSYPRVCQVMDGLYKDNLVTFNSKIEELLRNKNDEVLGLLSERPGEFRRRLIHTLNLFGERAVKAFASEAVINKLTTYQLVSLRSYLETVNGRKHRTFPPKGNWNKLQLGEARFVNDKHVAELSRILSTAITNRLPKVKVLDSATNMVKLPNNGEVGPYARGTVFSIPDDVEFIRTASYWQIQRTGNIWFDNGWNFFDANWKSLGACCWDRVVNYGNGAAIFSGDPTNSKDMQGKACQMIDLYLSKLSKHGVRFAVWNVLCFSNIPFAKADDVFAALQWGKDAEKGKLFEPSRCQLSFQLKGEQLTKYICYIDLETRQLVYMDANLSGRVNSASTNCAVLETNMPAFVEYLKSLPSVYDLFRGSVCEKEDGMHILYTDNAVQLNGESAYVFNPQNKNNKYKAVDLNGLL